ncbi:MAG: hypothetical protein EX330_00450 [Candidatus Brocadia sp. BROELEC01]|nr:hypothetical protein [Candidatus Brocadia sapporoensis]RZV59682.1 MAG: hypothetical protein EX330_00450 [Candidatus Brocadia sp. BROELEC01]
MMIAYGLYNACERDYKVVSLILALVLIVSMAVTSFKLVMKYHHDVPAPIQLIQFFREAI